MTHVIVVERNPTSGHFSALWLSEHSSNGIRGTGRNSYEALENLIVGLKANDRRLAMLAEIDSMED